MKDIQWLDNKELIDHAAAIMTRPFPTKYGSELVAELERRLRLSGFFDMPLEFYLRELGFWFDLCHEADRFCCYSATKNVEFYGKTALEAAKAAYKWKCDQDFEKLMTTNLPSPIKFKNDFKIPKP